MEKHWTAVATKDRYRISGKMPLIIFLRIGRRRKMKKRGYRQEEIRKQGLKGPRCTGTCQQTFEKSLNKKATQTSQQTSGKFDQKIVYRGECIKNGKLRR